MAVNAKNLNETEFFYGHKACAGCGLCARECFAGALTLAGTDMDEARAMDEILTDLPYFQQSGGGVTFSGGECMLQIDFLEALCRACREKGIHTAIDTAGCVPWARFERVLPYASLFLYDMKARDPRVHRRLTGAGGHDTVKLVVLGEVIHKGQDHVPVKKQPFPGAGMRHVGELVR